MPLTQCHERRARLRLRGQRTHSCSSSACFSFGVSPTTSTTSSSSSSRMPSSSRTSGPGSCRAPSTAATSCSQFLRVSSRVASGTRRRCSSDWVCMPWLGAFSLLPRGGPAYLCAVSGGSVRQFASGLAFARPPRIHLITVLGPAGRRRAASPIWRSHSIPLRLHHRSVDRPAIHLLGRRADPCPVRSQGWHRQRRVHVRPTTARSPWQCRGRIS